MSLTLSATARGVAPSATLKLNAAVAQMKSEGVPVLSLGAGEPDFDTPEHIRKAAIEAIVFAPVREESNQENVENNE